MNTEKISVIIPIYNVEKYIEECLDSVINQTYKNLEIIIVNDCSPANEEEIIKGYQENDDRIIYIKHEANKGLGGARNTGINYATGKYLTFLDSDDYLELNTYEKMISWMESVDANLGAFSAINFDDESKETYFDEYFAIDSPGIAKINYSNFTLICSTSVCMKIFKTIDVKNKVYFPEHLKHEDEEFWFNYKALVEPIAVMTQEQFYHRRIRKDSIMAESSYTRKDMGLIFQNIYNFLQEKDLMKKYKEVFLEYGVNLCYLPRDGFIEIKSHIKLLTDIKKILQNFSDNDLQKYKPFLYTKKMIIINEFWIRAYKLSGYNFLDKIKIIIKKIVKKISPK